MGVRSQQHEVRPPPPRPYWRSFRHRAHTCQLGLRSCRQDCPHQVPSSLVRPLQIYEASMGQTYGRVRRTHQPLLAMLTAPQLASHFAIPTASADSLPSSKAEIEKFQAMSADELTAAIAGKHKEGVDAEALFKSEVEKLQKTYEQLQKDK